MVSDCRRGASYLLDIKVSGEFEKMSQVETSFSVAKGKMKYEIASWMFMGSAPANPYVVLNDTVLDSNYCDTVELYRFICH